MSILNHRDLIWKSNLKLHWKKLRICFFLSDGQFLTNCLTQCALPILYNYSISRVGHNCTSVFFKYFRFFKFFKHLCSLCLVVSLGATEDIGLNEAIPIVLLRTITKNRQAYIFHASVNVLYCEIKYNFKRCLSSFLET